MKVAIKYAPYFLKRYAKIKKRDPRLAELVKNKIELFQNADNHQALRVHKLKHPPKTFAFLIDYGWRLIFEYGQSKNEVILLTITSHDGYL